jgi:hypothetical protein
VVHGHPNLAAVLTDTKASSDVAAFPYATHLNILFPQLEKVDVLGLVQACKDQWYNQTLCTVNNSVIRLGVMQGEYHWHKHDDDDEFFFVLDGNTARSGSGRRVCGRFAPRHGPHALTRLRLAAHQCTGPVNLRGGGTAIGP